MFENTIGIFDDNAKAYSNAYGGHNDEIFLLPFKKSLKKGAKLLDVGCGEGTASGYFFKNGFLIEGIDPSKGMLEVARQKNPEITFKEMDMRDLKYQDKSFDGLIVGYSLFLIPKKKVSAVLSGFARVLKPHGKILIITHYGSGEELVPFPLDKSKKMFVNFMDEKELSESLALAGFEVKQVLFREPLPSEIQHKKLGVIAELK